MKFILKVVVALLLLSLFQSMGWISFPGDQIVLFHNEAADKLTEMVIVATIVTLAVFLLAVAFAVFIAGTLGLGILLWPVKLLFIGPFCLLAVVMLLPGFLVVTATGGQIVVIGLVIGATHAAIDLFFSSD